MAKASPEVLKELENLTDAAAVGLSNVEKKKMFGCAALFANGSVFALIWKEGRIGVRLPIAEEFSALMKMPGAAPWKAGPMTMSHWVLVPETLQTNAAKLRAWVATAHAMALTAKKAPTKKTSAKKVPKKKAATVPAKPMKKAKSKHR